MGDLGASGDPERGGLRALTETSVLITGKGKGGSWIVRGEQLGNAIGGVVVPKAGSVDGFDLAVLVKRPTPSLLDALRGRPVVWDVVDAYPQPVGNEWTKPQALSWLELEVERIRPCAIVAATQAMALDCSKFGVPVLYLPHHARPGQKVNPIREKVKVVGYEGAEPYLGRWKPIVQRECDSRGWRFVINGLALSDMDIVIALRDCSGYPARYWKSGVKLANSQGSGTPCVLSQECGYLETRSGGERWAETEEQLKAAFDELASADMRRAVSQQLLAAAPRLETIATKYREWLIRLK